MAADPGTVGNSPPRTVAQEMTECCCCRQQTSYFEVVTLARAIRPIRHRTRMAGGRMAVEAPDKRADKHHRQDGGCWKEPAVVAAAAGVGNRCCYPLPLAPSFEIGYITGPSVAAGVVDEVLHLG